VTPIEMMFMAQQYQAPQGMLQVPKVGLLSVPDLSKSYTDMSLSDEEVRKVAEGSGILTPGANEPITYDVRMKVAGQRIKDIPGNIADVPENMMQAGSDIGSGLRDAAKGILGFFR